MTGSAVRRRPGPGTLAALGAGVVLVAVAIAIVNLGGPSGSATATTTPEASEPAQTDLGPLHTFPELEAKLPTAIAGKALDTFSLSGSEAGPAGSGGVTGSDAPLGTDEPMGTDDLAGTDEPPGTYPAPDLFAAAVRSLGRTPVDLQLAIARPVDRDADVVITAYRLPGVRAVDLLAKLGPDDVDGSIEPATVAGKSVLALLQIQATSYAYAADDVVYIVGGSPELIRAAIEALP